MNITFITEKATKLGYNVFIREGEIRYVVPADRSSYTPELFAPDEYTEGSTWTIQTCGYGPKDTVEISNVIDGLKRAQQMVDYLQAWASK